MQTPEHATIFSAFPWIIESAIRSQNSEIWCYIRGFSDVERSMLKPRIHWIALLLLNQPALAKITMAPLFQAGAVLQREKPVPVWGKASPGKQVTISFAGQTQTTTADANGRWLAELPAMQASADGRTLSVTEAGLPPVEIPDLLVGEVWLASGQSNMQWAIAQSRAEDKAVAAAGPVPLLRIFQAPRALNPPRLETLNAKCVFFFFYFRR